MTITPMGVSQGLAGRQDNDVQGFPTRQPRSASLVFQPAIGRHSMPWLVEVAGNKRPPY